MFFLLCFLREIARQKFKKIAGARRAVQRVAGELFKKVAVAVPRISCRFMKALHHARGRNVIVLGNCRIEPSTR